MMKKKNGFEIPEELKKKIDDISKFAEKQIEEAALQIKKVEDPKKRAFLLQSLRDAKSGKLDIRDFLKSVKKM